MKKQLWDSSPQFKRAGTTLIADQIHLFAVDAAHATSSLHPKMQFGNADMTTVVFNKFIKINPANPHRLSYDRFVPLA